MRELTGESHWSSGVEAPPRHRDSNTSYQNSFVPHQGPDSQLYSFHKWLPNE